MRTRSIGPGDPQYLPLLEREVSTAKLLPLARPIPGSNIVYKAYRLDDDDRYQGFMFYAFDTLKTQPYSTYSPTRRFHRALSQGPAFVGELAVYAGHEVFSRECVADYNALVQAAETLGLTVGETYNVSLAYVCSDSKPGCLTNYQGLGVGKALYTAVLSHLTVPNKVTFIVADACIGSTTSKQARYVYESLVKKTFVGNGLVLTSVRKGTPQGKALLAAFRRAKRLND